MSPVHIKVSLSAFLLLLGLARMALPAPAEGAPPHWSVMTDAWGTRVDYPAGIFTIDEGAPLRGMGRVLESSKALSGWSHARPPLFCEATLA